MPGTVAPGTMTPGTAVPGTVAPGIAGATGVGVIALLGGIGGPLGVAETICDLPSGAGSGASGGLGTNWLGFSNCWFCAAGSADAGPLSGGKPGGGGMSGASVLGEVMGDCSAGVTTGVGFVVAGAFGVVGEADAGVAVGTGASCAKALGNGDSETAIKHIPANATIFGTR